MRKLTDKRRAWLEHLRDHGPSIAPKIGIGYTCRAAGWTDWFVTDADTGETMPLSNMRAKFPDSYWDHIDGNYALDCITDLGRAILKDTPDHA